MKNQTKQKIMEEVIKLFAKKGFYAVSIREIAQNVGVTKPTLYYYFESKEEMKNEVFLYLMEHIFAYQSKEFKKTSSIKNNILQFMKILKNYNKTYPSYLKLLLQMSFSLSDEANRKFFEIFEPQITERIKKLYEGLANPSFEKSLILFSFIDSYATSIASGKSMIQDEKTEEKIAEQFEKILLQ